MRNLLLPAVLAASVTTSLLAKVTVPPLISDHMILQYPEAAVWGKADPGENITVTLGDTSAKATTGQDGNWSVRLQGLKPDFCGTLEIEGKNRISINDVLVGDVWLASGQSNMALAIDALTNKAEIRAAADHPKIRMFIVSRRGARTVQDEVGGKWVVCTPETIGPWSAAGYFFAQHLHGELRYPIGIICACVGNTQAQTWTPIEVLQANPVIRKASVEPWQKKMEIYPAAVEAHARAMSNWTVASDKAKAEGKPEPKKPIAPYGPDSTRAPAALYNAMIDGIRNYPIKGCIWYQGESDAQSADVYRELLPAMITSWRKAWGYDLPFLIVQLANFRKETDEPTESQWAEIRDVQRLVAKSLPHSGLAVTIDIGEASAVHPQNKLDVGRRLAMTALALVYGQGIVYSGPLFDQVSFKNGDVLISFEPRTAMGLKTNDGQPIKGFTLAGKDMKFYKAEAIIDSAKETSPGQHGIVIHSSKVPNPVAVRYAWADNPEVNLVNAAGLPASPFRSDNWSPQGKNPSPILPTSDQH